jgi:hypothetical protein
MSEIARDDLIEALARSSHEVYERHYRESGRPESEMVTEVNQHDRDRAQAAVDVLEELGIWVDPGGGGGLGLLGTG